MEDDHTRAVQIVTWSTVITSILVIIARVITKATTVRSITLGDYLISAALVSTSADIGWLPQSSAHCRCLAICHRTDGRRIYPKLSWIR